MTDECEHDRTPTALTAATLWESEVKWARRVVRALLDHAVQGYERSDECIAAVADAEEFIDAADCHTNNEKS
jgi:hypothetical protein